MEHFKAELNHNLQTMDQLNMTYDKFTNIFMMTLNMYVPIKGQ